MMNFNNAGGCLKRELVRILLERVQGESMKQSMETEEPEDESKQLFEVEEQLNNPYMNRSEVPLAMDIFKPKVPEGKELPVIVIIHGGGLVVGDRKISRRFGKSLAGRGYLVFSIEYRLAPRANAAEQLDDVCAGMDLVGRRIVDFDVDMRRRYLIAESAGAYLAMYVAAMKNSEKLQKAIGYKPTRMTFKGIGLICGMLYTNKPDPIGWLMSEQFYGDKRTDPEFLQYMDPENPEIINNLPPAFLVTSRGDFLNNYSLMFHEALKKAGRTSHLVYYGEQELSHAFPVMKPYLPQSRDSIDRMLEWFEQQMQEALKNEKERKNNGRQKNKAAAAN